jgi:phosphatidylglycerophosphate synthase
MHIFLRPFFKSKGQSLPANLFGKLKTVVQSVFSITILTFLILKQLLIILINLNENIITTYDFYMYITAYIFFAIITFLSLLSLVIYLFKSKKILVNGSN